MNLRIVWQVMHEGIQLKSQNKKLNQIVKEFHGKVAATTVTLMTHLLRGPTYMC